MSSPPLPKENWSLGLSPIATQTAVEKVTFKSFKNTSEWTFTADAVHSTATTEATDPTQSTETCSYLFPT